MWQVTTCHFRRNISVKTTVIKMALRPGSGGGGSFIYPVGGSLGPPQGMMPIQQPQQQPFPGMVQVPMQPSMQGMMGMNFRGQIPPGAIPMQGGMTMGMQAPGIQFMGQPQFMGMRAPGPQYTADMQKQMAEEHQKRVEQQQRMLEEDRKRRQFEEQKQKLRLLSSVKPKGPMGASRDDALEAIKGNLDGFSRDAKMHPTPSSHPKKPGTLTRPVVYLSPLSGPSLTLLIDGLDSFALTSISVSVLLMAGVGGYPQEHIQPMVPGWLYNDSLIPEMFKKVLEFTMTPGGIDTAKLYPILMSSGLPREALGQIWASANRTTPGMLTKEELYTVLALIGVAQSGLPAMNVEILSQFPSPPVPNLPALAMALAPVLPQQPMMTQPPVPVTMAMPSTAPSVMTMVPLASTQPNTNFVTNFPPIQVPRRAAVPTSPLCNTFALFVFTGEGFADFKSVSVDDGFTDFKTADSISPLDPPDQAKMFQPAFPPAFPISQSLPQLQHQPAVSLSQPKNPLNMADLDLFSMVPSAPAHAPADTKPGPFPSVVLPPGGAKPTGGGPDDFGDFALFGPASSAEAGPASQDDFADFMAFASSVGEAKAEDARSGDGGTGVRGEANTASQLLQQGSDKYYVFKQMSLEGGLTFDDNKESTGGSFSSLKSEADDFADFQSSKFCSALGSSDKSLVDKVAMFKHGGKEDSSSVKSLDLPSIGGSSVGKEDSEDTLSVQLDMKLSDMGGDLKHVMSDSSLDLPGLSAHQPPAADDMKFDPFGTSAVSSMACYDWSDREECLSSQGQVKRHAGLDDAGSSSFPSSAVVHRKETLFSSTENITVTRISQTKITTFSTEDNVSADSKFEALADFGSGEPGGLGGDEDDDFGDFASTVSETSESPAAMVEPGSEGNLNQASDDFGAFQGDKAKFGKSDFLKASSQTKVKSSEEMIKSELATFDLSVQGTHKRSHSLGEKEIGRSPPSPAPEQPFRDRSNTLSEKPALPVIRDKYKDLTGEVEESERYAYEWQRCLESALQVITKANNTLNSISSSTVCTEVIQSAQGMEYLLGVVEVYRVTKRVELGVKATAVCSEKLQQLLKDISRVWNNLMGFMSLANLAPDESSLDFSSCILRHGIKNAKELACGVCLLNVDSRSKAFNSETDNFKLLYGGHQYHASCANFWINCVEPKPPGLILPDLL
uniref:Synergin, gamma n=1 Tax=Esox lucius TaxID=8010 RepID=A0A6Q2Z6H9_ESOLU